MYRAALHSDGMPASFSCAQAITIDWSCEGRLAAGTTSGWVVLADVDSHGNARRGVCLLTLRPMLLVVVVQLVVL